jgi:CBS domain-containing protein
MLASDIMTTSTITATSDTLVLKAAQMMLQHNISCLPVVDDKDSVIGILTHTDFGLNHKLIGGSGKIFMVLGTYATPKSFEKITGNLLAQKVGEVMSKNLITVEASVNVSEVINVMIANKVNRIPVLRKGKLVGIISRHDLLKVLVQQ